MQCDALAKDHLTNKDDFWKKLKIINNGKMTKYSSVVGNAKDDDSIAALWKQSFENRHTNEGMLSDTCKYASNWGSIYIITVDDVSKAVQNIKLRKSCGPDGLAPKPIKYGGSATVHLTLLFNIFSSHWYLPDELTKTTIVPMVKNKAGDTSDMNNYRAIALSTFMSKVLESVLLTCFQSRDDYDDYHQFGFKRKHSTTPACSALKSTVDY